MKIIICIALGYSVASCIGLWINLWNLHRTMFELHEGLLDLIQKLSRELRQRPTENDTDESADLAEDEV